MGILCLKVMYKIIMDELQFSNYSFLYLWRESIVTETHFGFSSIHLCRITGMSVWAHLCSQAPASGWEGKIQMSFTCLPSTAYSSPIFEGLAGRYMWIILSSIRTSPSTLRSEPQYLWPFLDYLLRCFTAFLFPMYKNYGIAPCQLSGSTATKVNKTVRLCSHNSPLCLSLFKLLIHFRSPRVFDINFAPGVGYFVLLGAMKVMDWSWILKFNREDLGVIPFLGIYKYTQDDTTYLNLGRLEFCTFPCAWSICSTWPSSWKEGGMHELANLKLVALCFLPFFKWISFYICSVCMSLCVCVCVCNWRLLPKTQKNTELHRGREQHGNMTYKIILTHPNWICAFASGRWDIIT